MGKFVALSSWKKIPVYHSSSYDFNSKTTCNAKFQITYIQLSWSPVAHTVLANWLPPPDLRLLPCCHWQRSGISYAMRGC